MDTAATGSRSGTLAVNGSLNNSSVTVNGVSLTVNRVADSDQGCEVHINLIPHTLAATTLKRLQPGSRVNLEVDLIARYVERMLGANTPNTLNTSEAA